MSDSKQLVFSNLQDQAAHDVILEMAKAGAFNPRGGYGSNLGEDLGICIASLHQKLSDYYRTREDGQTR